MSDIFPGPKTISTAYRDAHLEQSRKREAAYRERNREHIREWHRANYWRYRDKIIARAVAWRKDRRRDFAMKVNQLARKHGALGKIDWRDLIYGDCAYCGKPCRSWDHVIPMSRGGSNTLDNLVPACWSCNNWKKARTPEEWWEAIS